MKFKRLFSCLALSSLLAVGVGVGVGVRNEVKEAKAEDWKQNPTIYFVASTNWGDASATFKMNYYDGSDYKGVVVATDSGFEYDSRTVYSFTVTDNTWVSRVQFLRMNSDGSKQWNYSGTFTISDDYSTSSNNFLIMTSSFATYDNWSTGDSGISWGSSSAFATYRTITKYGVYDGVLDSANPLGSDTVLDGATYATPGEIYKSGNVFGGWYSNSECTIAWSEETAINTNTPIYAKYTWHGNWEGTINVDLRTSGWADAAHNYAIYFFNDVANAWSEYVSVSANVTYFTIDYEIGFDPDGEKMILVEYASSVTEASWEEDRWDTKTAQTSNIDYSEMITVIYDDEHDTYWCATDNYAKVYGGTSGQAWSLLATLSSIKLNGSNHAEYYSTSVSLTKGQAFKIVHGDNEYYGYYSTYYSISENFSGGEGNDIEVETSGTYSLYFDSYTHNVYITDPVIAAADEWAETFLGTNCADTKSRWSSLSSSFALLAPEVKAVFTSIAYNPDPEAATSTYYEAAVLRYDYIIMLYGKGVYADFMGRETAQSLTYKPASTVPTIVNEQETVSIITVVTITVVSALAVGGYFLLRRRKED